MSQNSNRSTPLSQQLLVQLDWLMQLWATGAEPSEMAQATLVQLDLFQRWTGHRSSLQHERLKPFGTVVLGLLRQVTQVQGAILTALLQAAAQIPGNGSAEELAIALQFLSPSEQEALLNNITQQWNSQARFQHLLRLALQVAGREGGRSPQDVRDHLHSLFEARYPQANQAAIQALSLFLLHQLSLTEGQTLAAHLLAQHQSFDPPLDPLLEQVAYQIIQAPAEAIDLEDCPRLIDLLTTDEKEQ